MRVSQAVAAIAGSLTLTLWVVAGLLTFPSTCSCGAELPHPHALYLLAHHHHGDRVGTVGSDVGDQTAAVDGGHDGPILTSVSDDGYGVAFAVALPSLAELPWPAPAPAVAGDRGPRAADAAAPPLPPPRPQLA